MKYFHRLIGFSFVSLAYLLSIGCGGGGPSPTTTVGTTQPQIQSKYQNSLFFARQDLYASFNSVLGRNEVCKDVTTSHIDTSHLTQGAQDLVSNTCPGAFSNELSYLYTKNPHPSPLNKFSYTQIDVYNLNQNINQPIKTLYNGELLRLNSGQVVPLGAFPPFWLVSSTTRNKGKTLAFFVETEYEDASGKLKYKNGIKVFKNINEPNESSYFVRLDNANPGSILWDGLPTPIPAPRSEPNLQLVLDPQGEKLYFVKLDILDYWSVSNATITFYEHDTHTQGTAKILEYNYYQTTYPQVSMDIPQALYLREDATGSRKLGWNDVYFMHELELNHINLMNMPQNSNLVRKIGTFDPTQSTSNLPYVFQPQLFPIFGGGIGNIFYSNILDKYFSIEALRPLEFHIYDYSNKIGVNQTSIYSTLSTPREIINLLTSIR